MKSPLFLPPLPPAAPSSGGSVTPVNEPTVESTGEQKAAGDTATDQPGSKKATDPANKPQMEVDKLELEIEALKYKRSFVGRAQDVIAVGPLNLERNRISIRLAMA
jgi:hypothetical protein